jgi:putative spermidine/putrescine transport system ATP-binding protein
VADFIGTINRLPCRIRGGSLVLPGKPIPLEQVPHVRTQGREIVDVFFRPEHATVVEAGQGHLSATILATFFMGDRTRLIVKGSTPEHLTIEASGHQSFNTGRQVDIEIDPSALLTLHE